MSLWTPYAEEALDLSKSVQERVHPDELRILTHDEATPRPYAYVYPHHSGLFLPARENSTFVPVPSPDSARSSLSPYSKIPTPSQSPEFYEADSLSDDVEYQEFERDALRAMALRNGGTFLGNNPRMRRAVQSKQTDDDSYRKQREKNNFAAKQSRDRRKLREVRLAFQVTFLQKKVAALQARLGARCCARCQQQCQC